MDTDRFQTRRQRSLWPLWSTFTFGNSPPRMRITTYFQQLRHIPIRRRPQGNKRACGSYASRDIPDRSMAASLRVLVQSPRSDHVSPRHFDYPPQKDWPISSCRSNGSPGAFHPLCRSQVPHWKTNLIHKISDRRRLADRKHQLALSTALVQVRKACTE